MQISTFIWIMNHFKITVDISHIASDYEGKFM